jgi:hypothetical protein
MFISSSSFPLALLSSFLPVSTLWHKQAPPAEMGQFHVGSAVEALNDGGLWCRASVIGVNPARGLVRVSFVDQDSKSNTWYLPTRLAMPGKHLTVGEKSRREAPAPGATAFVCVRAAFLVSSLSPLLLLSCGI